MFVRLVSFLVHPNDVGENVRKDPADKTIVCSHCSNRLGRSLDEDKEKRRIPDFAYELWKDKVSVDGERVYSPVRRLLLSLLDMYLSKWVTVRQAIQFFVDETVRASDVVIPCDLMDVIALRNAVKQASPHSEVISFTHSVFYYLLSPVCNKHTTS